ncbi:MAG: KpsF/GutQ family sugar-phosphate isomerase [Alphaproteobacteria bacterium]
MTETAGLEALASALDNDLAVPFELAVARIRDATGRVVVSGMGKSGHVGRKIAATLASTGTPAFFVHPAEASHGDLGMVTGDDVVLALSWSGETPELRNLIEYTRRWNIPLIAITASRTSALAQQGDVVLVLPTAEEACPHGLAPTTSAIMQLALGDALAIALLESHEGFTAEHYHTFHPGGRLGADLHAVAKIMHRGDAMPLAKPGTAMDEALVTMTEKGLGCLGVVDPDGALIGIITDGDLRRHLGPDLLRLSVGEVMTPAPKTIAPEVLVGAALDLLNQAKITSLFVVEEMRPVGVVHMHDLLRVGVA